jgi:NhaA family Na+:H+ antiporter
MTDKKSEVSILADPFLRFVRIEVMASIILLVAVIIALFWANSQWAEYYLKLWNNELSLKVNGFYISKSFAGWINEGLMAIFFFLIGIEIKRELLAGELSSFKKGALPLIAALGGMTVSVIIYLYLNKDSASESGWCVPMATDIALALGVLGLLGNRVPPGMKVFVLACAIASNLGSVFIVSIFYNTGINFNFLIIGLGLFFVLVFLNQVKVRNYHLYMPVGFIIWYMFLRAGIHPALAGILIAFTIPLRRKIKIPGFKHLMTENLQEFSGKVGTRKMVLNKAQLAAVYNMGHEIEKVQSPLQFLEFKLHAFVAYIIIPVFALANAGVIIYTMNIGDIPGSLSFNTGLSMVAGKLAGIFLFSWIGVKTGIAILPEKTGWIHMIGLSLLGGVGFTISLFISNLAFADAGLINDAKTGVMAASLVSGLLGFIVLRLSLTKQIT